MLGRTLALLGFLFLVFGCQSSSNPTHGPERIRLNQVGFYANAPKMAVVVGAPDTIFHVIQAATGDTVHSGTLGPSERWDLSGETLRTATFSGLKAPGGYRIAVPGVGTTHTFSIGKRPLRRVARSALRGYYFQRASTSLSREYAGRWARPAGHPDDRVRVHASASSPARPESTLIAAQKGWYDAGDYNKYVVNSGISTYTLLALYEHAPGVAEALRTQIPESTNSLPDVLDEALWNLRWMLAMQALDGGVYHKLTHPSFSGMVMPHESTAARFVVQKGTAATLNFAAVLAQASRLAADHPQALSGLADSMRSAALDAWTWARRHPDVPYDQRELNASFEPDITTGAYGDRRFADEFAWAAAELSVTTGADSFLVAHSPVDLELEVPSWATVGALGWYTLLEHRGEVASAIDTAQVKRRYLAFADRLVHGRRDVPYRTVMGHSERDFRWGSSGVAGNQAMALLQAYRLTGDKKYREAALANVDYLLGRNATGYSFLTGVGDRTPMHIHHRPSEADTVRPPVPGLLAGGPNPGQQDRENCRAAGVDYPSDRPAQSYVDHLCSYASNEVTINWNAPLVYSAALLDAAYAERGGIAK